MRFIVALVTLISFPVCSSQKDEVINVVCLGYLKDNPSSVVEFEGKVQNYNSDNEELLVRVEVPQNLMGKEIAINRNGCGKKDVERVNGSIFEVKKIVTSTPVNPPSVKKKGQLEKDSNSEELTDEKNHPTNKVVSLKSNNKEINENKIDEAKESKTELKWSAIEIPKKESPRVLKKVQFELPPEPTPEPVEDSKGVIQRYMEFLSGK